MAIGEATTTSNKAFNTPTTITTTATTDSTHETDHIVATARLDEERGSTTLPTIIIMKDRTDVVEFLAVQEADGNLLLDNDIPHDEYHNDEESCEDDDEEASLRGWIVVDQDARSHVSQLTHASHSSVRRKRRTAKNRRKENPGRTKKEKRKQTDKEDTCSCTLTANHRTQGGNASIIF